MKSPTIAQIEDLLAASRAKLVRKLNRAAGTSGCCDFKKSFFAGLQTPLIMWTKAAVAVVIYMDGGDNARTQFVAL